MTGGVGPSGMTGMNIDEVEALAVRFDSSADHLTSVVRHLELTLATLEWVGPDGEHFRHQEWPQHRTRLQEVSGRLSEAGRVVRTNIAEQRAASSAWGSGIVTTPTGVPSIPIDLPGDWKWNRDKSPLYRQGKGDTDPIDPDDVQQGMLGDCFLLANLKALAMTNPELIRRLIHDNGNGTYDVTFYENGKPVTVTVNNEFPTLVKPFWFDDRVPFAKRGDGELWVRVIEKAYVQHFHGGYDSLPDGYVNVALEHLTGVESTPYGPSWMSDADLDDMGAKLAAGRIVATTGTPHSAEAAGVADLYHSKGIVERHAYAVQSIDTVHHLVHLADPHYAHTDTPDHDLVLTYDEYRKSFNQLFTVPSDVTGTNTNTNTNTGGSGGW